MTTFATHNPLIHDFNSDLVASALGHSLHDGTDLLGDPTLAADDLTHVAFGNTQFQNLALIGVDFGNSNRFGSSTRFFAIYSKSSFIGLNSFWGSYRTPAFFSRPRTVSVG